MYITKIISIFIGLFFILGAKIAFAVPILQVYIEGATYNSSSETWVVSSGNFRLWVIGNVNGPGGQGTIEDVKLAAAFSSSETGSISLTGSTTGGYGGFTDPSTSAAPVFLQTNTDGSSPTLGDGSSLASHGIYGAGTSWKEWALGDFALTDSPIEDFITSFPTAPAVTEGQINVYSVSVTGYTNVHFDAYNHVGGETHAKYVFAPFSHDGEGSGGGVPPASIPEPTTLLLSIMGLLALVGFRRRSVK